MADEFAKDMLRLFDLTAEENANPRVVAIVCAAYIENHLTGLIRERLPGITPSLTKSLFNDRHGPLGTSASRIDIAEAMEAIHSQLAEDARLIARIRNKFAHDLHVDSFDHPKVRDLVDKLQAGCTAEVRRSDGSTHLIGANWTRAQRFTNSAVCVCTSIMQRHIKEFSYSYTEPSNDGAPSRTISTKRVQNTESNPRGQDR